MLTSIWRLIQSSPAKGSWNMAVDEAILEAVACGESDPTLRLFAWDPACLSLGYAQPVADVDLHALHAEGWELVRRPTGGRAILHADELTYSVTGPTADPHFSGGVLECYQRLSQALLKALLNLGLPAQADKQANPPSPSDPKGPVCFEVSSTYEITVNGKKLIGSAQARRGEGVLQHGSLPLSGDITRITRVLLFSNQFDQQKATQRLFARALTAETALGSPVTWQQAAQAFINAFQTQLDLSFVPGTLSSKEELRALELQEQKYAHSNWTNRV